MKKNKIYRMLLLVFVCSFCFCLQSEVAFAKSQNAKAIEAYQKILVRSKINYSQNGTKYSLIPKQFALVDIDGNGVKELFVRESYKYLVYAFNGKKAVLVAANAISMFGWPSYCSKTKAVRTISMASPGAYETDFIKIKSNCKLEKINLSKTNNSRGGFNYYINGKKVSKSVYLKKENSLINNKNYRWIQFVNNNYRNRKSMNSLKYMS